MKKIILFFLVLNFFVASAQFTQQANIYPDNITAGDEFGSATEINDNWMAIGAYYYNSASNSPGYGSVYMWHYDGTDWTEFQQLVPTGAYNGDQFGNAVSIHGSNLIIGAWNASTDGDHNPGKAYFYEYNGSEWEHVSTFVSGINDYDIGYGTSVDIFGDYAIVGAPGAFSNGGRAYISYKDAGTWGVHQNLGPVSSNEDYFGSSVAINDNIAFVGARGENKVHVFERSGTTWTETGTITPSDGGTSFGTSLSYDGSTLIVGDEGENAAYIFSFDGTNWNEQKITASDGSSTDHFAKSVSISGSYAIIGAWGKNSMAGASYIFKNTSGTWSQLQKITASNGNSNDRFGTAVAIQNYTALIGAFYDNVTGSESGSAYIFEMPLPPAPTISVQPENSTVCEGSTATFSITATEADSYQWYNGSGLLTDGGDISGASSNQLSIANTEQVDEDDYYCIVTGDGGSLQSNNASLSVDVLETATTGSDIIVCVNYTSLSANSPSTGTGTWTIQSGGATIDDPNNNNTIVSDLVMGLTVFRWTIQNGVCISSDDLTVNYNLPESNAGSNQTITTSSTTLGANIPEAGETGEWVVVAGSGVFTDANLYNTVVSDLSDGENIFRWSISNSNCENSDEVTITVDLSGSVKNIKNSYSIEANPSNGIFVIKKMSNNISNLKIYDINGRLIYQSRLDIFDNIVNISNCKKGVYIISIQENTNIIYKKIIIK